MVTFRMKSFFIFTKEDEYDEIAFCKPFARTAEGKGAFAGGTGGSIWDMVILPYPVMKRDETSPVIPTLSGSAKSWMYLRIICGAFLISRSRMRCWKKRT